MTRKEVLDKIAAQRPTLERYGVSSLSVFGSVARGEERADSDVDLLVEFSQPVGLLQFVRLRRFLRDTLGQPVDLATPSSLKHQLREAILKEAIRAA